MLLEKKFNWLLFNGLHCTSQSVEYWCFCCLCFEDWFVCERFKKKRDKKKLDMSKRVKNIGGRICRLESNINYKPTNKLELGNQAVWSLSSAKPGYGVEQLRDNSLSTYWQLSFIVWVFTMLSTLTPSFTHHRSSNSSTIA